MPVVLESNAHYKHMHNSHRGRCKSRRGLTGRWNIAYSTSFSDVCLSSKTAVMHQRIRKQSIQESYSIRRRTFPKAGTYIMYIYYDWGQRPCPSPPFTRNRSRISSSDIIRECLRPCWNTKQLWAIQKNLPVGSITLTHTFQQGT
jgi:hypothetical protein